MFNFGWTSPFKEQQPCGCGTFSIRRASLFSVCSHETSFPHCVFAQISSTKPTVDHIHRVRVSSPDSYLCVILRGGNKTRLDEFEEEVIYWMKRRSRMHAQTHGDSRPAASFINLLTWDASFDTTHTRHGKLTTVFIIISFIRVDFSLAAANE